jgi:2-amino-4-hydroxy-6-hydroxymethyldihydropteridine diphosphokinase
VASVLIALGGNVGDVRATFRKAIAHICGMAQAALVARSSDYATPPWGDAQQDRFINACIAIETGLDPHALLFVLHKVEAKFGRDRAHERRWGPRTLDLDIIAYDDMRLDKPELTLPHPRLFERAFVLVADRRPDAAPGPRWPHHRWHRTPARFAGNAITNNWLGLRPMAFSRPDNTSLREQPSECPRQPTTSSSPPNFPPPAVTTGASW